MVKLLVFLKLFFFSYPSAIYADTYKVDLSGELESDPVSKSEELLLKIKQEDDNKKYQNKISLKIDKGYQIANGISIQNKELFDYEQDFKLFFKEQKSFVALYFRYKDDDFGSSTSQNYSISSLGYGVQKQHKKEKVSLEFFVGQRHNSEKNIIIIRPVISYKNEYKKFLYEISSTVVRGSNFKIFKNDLEVTYPLSEILSLKYIVAYEESIDQDENDFERSNKIALSFKF